MFTRVRYKDVRLCMGGCGLFSVNSWITLFIVQHVMVPFNTYVLVMENENS